MHFGFALELSDINLWNIDLLDTHLDLLSPGKYTDIPSKYFVCLHNIFKTSSRHVFKTSSRHVFKTYSRHVLKTSSRCLQHNNFMSSKTSWRRLENVLKTPWRHLTRPLEDVFKTSLQDVFKTSSRCLQGVLEDIKLLCWRCVEDVFKTNKCLLGVVPVLCWYFYNLKKITLVKKEKFIILIFISSV